MRDHVRSDLLSTAMWVFPPVVRIDLVAHRHIAHVLREFQGADLVLRVRFLIYGIWGPKQDAPNSQPAGEEPFCKVQLQLHETRRDVADVRMREGVVPDLVAFVVDATRDRRELVCLDSDQEESCGSM